MSSGFDYSKWDNIELSDDEDDVHPNIERESWFRMKHRSRVEREEREEADKKKIKTEMAAGELRITEIKMMLASISNGGADDDSDSDDDDLEDTEGLEAELQELHAANKIRVEKLETYEKNKKWNVDNICTVKEERTIINPKGGEQKFSSTGYALPDDDDADAAPPTATAQTARAVERQVKQEHAPAVVSTAAPPPSTSSAASSTTTVTSSPNKKVVAGPTSESVAMLSYHEFTERYAPIMEHFMTLSSLEQSKRYLLLHGNILLQENSSNYLLLASLEDEMNGCREKMRLTARQSQIISNVVELAKSMHRHPGNVIAPFFKRIDEREFFTGFIEGVEVFIQRIIARSVDKKKEMDREREEEEAEAAASNKVDLSTVPKEERLGPGGGDPVEVFESLPVSMQEAFESRDTDKLKEALLAMDSKDVEYHMKRCVDSGLWNE